MRPTGFVSDLRSCTPRGSSFAATADSCLGLRRDVRLADGARLYIRTVNLEETIVVISGPVCSGKTTLGRGLADACGAEVVTTRILIARHLDRQPDELSRSELQAAGEALDEERGGAWVAEKVAEMRRGLAAPVVVDAIRNAAQLDALRGVAETFHVHLRADPEILAARYERRISSDPQLEFPNFSELRANPTEAAVGELASEADLVLDSGEGDEGETKEAVLLLLG